MAKLTTKSIKAAHYEGEESGAPAGWKRGQRRDVRWDDELPGFGLRIYPSGRKAFVVSYRTEGRKRMMVVGDFGTLTLAQARTRARKHLVAIDDGTDPIEERQRAAQGETFKDLRTKYLDEYAKPRKKSWAEDERRMKLHLPATWNGRKVSAITNQDIARLHAKIGTEHPFEANRVLSLVHKMFERAAAWGFVEKQAPNPAAGIETFRERSRKRWLKPEELPALAAAIDQEPSIYIRAALWLYLLTGARKSELLLAKRRDVDFGQGVLRLPETKSGEEQSLPLNAPAIAIVQAIPAMAGNSFLFPSTRKPGGRLVNLKPAWRRVRDRASIQRWAEDADPVVSGILARLSEKLGRMPTRAEIERDADAAGVELPTALLDLRIHDLRRTVGSWLTKSGVDLNLIKNALRHSNLATTLTYARLGQDAAREAMEEHGRKVMEIAGKAWPREIGG